MRKRWGSSPSRWGPCWGSLSLLIAAGLASAPPSFAAERTYRLRSPLYSLDGFQTRLVRSQVPVPRVPQGYVTYMYARLVDTRGNRVPIRKVMLHHAVFLSYGSRARAEGSSCPGTKGQPFYGTGEEHQSLRLPEGYGYPFSSRDPWFMQAMLMSHRMSGMHVAVEYRVRVSTKPLQRVRPFWLRTTGCAPPEFEVHGGGAPGATQVDSRVWKAPISGRLVAAGGHLHGGAQHMALTEPRCGGRRLLDTDPWFGLDSHPVYQVRPQLHEPGPIATRTFLSETGIPVRKGQKLRLVAVYDNERPHPQAMAIVHIYIAPEKEISLPKCSPLPEDRRSVLLHADEVRPRPFDVPGRPRSPAVNIPLVAVGSDGLVAPIPWPPGRTTSLRSGAVVDIRDNAFEHPKITLPLGSDLTWAFRDPRRHNVVLANGPWSAGAPLLSYRSPHRYTTNFPRPGRYQLFCQFHPLTMHQQVIVPPPSAEG